MKSFGPLSLLAAGLALPLAARAQNELSNFSATGRGGVINTFASDYQAIGINPANLGRNPNFRVAFTVGEVGAGIGSRVAISEGPEAAQPFRPLVKPVDAGTSAILDYVSVRPLEES